MMAGYARPIQPGVGADDIKNASRAILQSTTADEVCQESSDIGSRFNQWCKPVTEYGSNKPAWEVKLKSSPYIGEIDFGRRAWARARAAVDEVLRLLKIEMLAYAEEHYKGLRIENYIRMGSSRDGLKIIAPDEFDVLLQFHIEGLALEVVQLRKDRSSKVIPEFSFCHLQVNRSMTWLQEKFPKLYKDGVFQEDNTGSVKLDARQLYQAVFESMVDRAVRKITQKIAAGVSGSNVCFQITRRINPPSVNITIHLNDKVYEYFMPGANIRDPNDEIRQIDVDIVPGFLIRTDKVPDPNYPGRSLECPLYAVTKWAETSSARGSILTDPEVVWRVSSSGYERHTIDVARSNQRQLYVLTALRVLKTYFRKTKAAAQEKNQTPPQITTFFSSYHLKHIAFYVLLYLCYIHKGVRIHGVSDVLQYFLQFMECSLDKKRLPHFFHANKKIRVIYPTYPLVDGELRFNLLMRKSDEAYRQATMSLEHHLMSELVFKWEDSDETRTQTDFSWGGGGGMGMPSGCSSGGGGGGGRLGMQAGCSSGGGGGIGMQSSGSRGGGDEARRQILAEYRGDISYGDFFSD